MSNTITGFDAIEYAKKYGVPLSKYADPTEEAREGLTIDEAREVAAEDQSLIYVTVATAKAVPYKIDVDMLGESDFTGSLGDLVDFVEILIEVTGRPEGDFLLRQHISQEQGSEEPSEHEWQEAQALFRELRPDLFGGVNT